MRTATVIVTGILLASSVIVGITLLQREGILPEIPTTSISSYTSSSTSSTPHSTSAIISTSSSSISKSASTNFQGATGNLILQIHDPPHVPPGVSAVSLAYADILFRSSDGRWVDSKVNGSIDLLTVVNFTQTIANLKLNGGRFDQLLMKLSSVIVTSNSKNYVATLSTNQLTIPIVGGLTVFNSSKSGVVIDVSPTVIQHSLQNSTGGTTTWFVLVPSADGYVIPENQINLTKAAVGDREDIRDQGWLTTVANQLKNQTSFQISTVSLSSSGFFVTVKNTGNTSVLLQTVFIESNVTQFQSTEDDSRYNIGSSVLFGVLSNGSLIPFVDGESGDGPQANIGYNLSANTQVTLSYRGPIPSSISTETGSGEGNGITTITQSSSTSSGQTASGSEDSSIQPMVNDGSLVTSTSSNPNPFGFQITAGASYLVGVTSGDLTISTRVVAN